MTPHLSFIAIGLWVVSLFVPTIPGSGDEVLVGYQLVGRSLGMAMFFPMSLFYPLHLFGLASNLIVLHECLFALLQRYRPARSLFSLGLLGVVLLVNIYLAFASLGNGKGLSAPPLRGILGFPGYYLWVSAFAFLFASRLVHVRRTNSTPAQSEARDA